MMPIAYNLHHKRMVSLEELEPWIQEILDGLKLEQNEKEMLEHIICLMETESGMDRAAAIADMRFSFIQDICDEAVIKPRESKEHARSTKIDKILTGKYTAIPCFIGIMGLVVRVDDRDFMNWQHFYNIAPYHL